MTASNRNSEQPVGWAAAKRDGQDLGVPIYKPGGTYKGELSRGIAIAPPARDCLSTHAPRLNGVTRSASRRRLQQPPNPHLASPPPPHHARLLRSSRRVLGGPSPRLLRSCVPRHITAPRLVLHAVGNERTNDAQPTAVYYYCTDVASDEGLAEAGAEVTSGAIAAHSVFGSIGSLGCNWDAVVVVHMDDPLRSPKPSHLPRDLGP